MKHKSNYHLQEALTHIQKLEQYSQYLMSGATGQDILEIVLDAVSHRLATLIDTLAKLGRDQCVEMFGDDWDAMRGVRNRIAHDYLRVDLEVVSITVQEELPVIKAIIEDRLSTLQ